MHDVTVMVEEAARWALLAEITLYPKPGLVSPVDSGAHQDMDLGTFHRSIESLRGYFGTIAEAGERGAPFSRLRDLGLQAEQTMLRATNGINTHRGAIFSLGLLAAGAGWNQAHGLPIEGSSLVQTVVRLWGPDLETYQPAFPASHGSLVVARYGARGARSEAAAGFPTLIEVALPALRGAESRGADPGAAGIQGLFAVMAVLEDTNLLHRGGVDGLVHVQQAARTFLEEGGVSHPNWRDRAVGLHRDFVHRNLSPGGSADVLAAALFLRELEDW
jgi:triphosphoribosyl-dephospho-CoA synthase